MTIMTQLSLTEYKPLALRTEKALPTNDARLHHAALGLITEVGELTTEFKRSVIYGKPWDEDRVSHVFEELGDICWYLAIGFDACSKQMAINETFLPVNWNRKTLNDKLTYLAEFLALSVGMMVVSLNSIESESRLAGLDNALQSILSAVSYAIDSFAKEEFLSGATLGFVLHTNIEKLKLRFPEAYTDEAAEARADKDGADARSS